MLGAEREPQGVRAATAEQPRSFRNLPLPVVNHCSRAWGPRSPRLATNTTAAMETGPPWRSLIDFTTLSPTPSLVPGSQLLTHGLSGLLLHVPTPGSVAPAPQPGPFPQQPSLPSRQVRLGTPRKHLSLRAGPRARPARPAPTSAGAGRWPGPEPRGRWRHLLASRPVGGSRPMGGGGTSPPRAARPPFIRPFPCILHLCPKGLGPSQDKQ